MAKAISRRKRRRRRSRAPRIVLFCLLALVLAALAIYFGVLQYPELGKHPITGKWYRVTAENGKTSVGGTYRAFYRQGDTDKVLIYFSGGGISFNEETARSDVLYNAEEYALDIMVNKQMNDGGIMSDSDENPFADWTIIALPYTTGDFHSGTGEFAYTDDDGTEKILYHYGYINFTDTMTAILERTGLDPDTVVVAGFSAGGFAASMLADEVFSTYFPNADDRTVLVDSSVTITDSWYSIASNVWQTPEAIAERLTGDDLMLDSMTALREKYGYDVKLLFICSVRDGVLTRIQNYFDSGSLSLNDAVVDNFQSLLKESVEGLRAIGASVFIFDSIPYDDDETVTCHTLIYSENVYVEIEEFGLSAAEWISNSMIGILESYGVDLLDKEYS